MPAKINEIDKKFANIILWLVIFQMAASHVWSVQRCFSPQYAEPLIIKFRVGFTTFSKFYHTTKKCQNTAGIGNTLAFKNMRVSTPR